MKRHRVIQLVLLLVAGAIVNVAVAWGCALFIPLSDDWQYSDSQAEFGVPDDPSAPGIWEAWFFSQPGTHYVYISWSHVPITWMAGSEGTPRNIIPDWAMDFAPSRAERLTYSAERLAVASGWPCVAMHSLVERKFANGMIIDTNVSGLETSMKIVGLSHQNGYLAGKSRILPLTPIWPGFAINTIFYAAILWGVFFAPGKLKRTLRRRRGLCPSCAYPVGISPVCTECGGAVAPSARAFR